MIRNVLKFAVAASSAVFLFVLLVAAGRWLGPQDFGRFSFALAFVLFFDPILDPGLYHLMIREISRDRSVGGKYLFHVLLWKGAAVPAVFAAIRLIVPRIDPSAETLTAVLLIAVSQVLKSVKDAFRSSFISHERFEREMISLGAERLGLLIAGLAAMRAGFGLRGLCMAFVVIRAADVLLAWSLARGLVGPLPRRFDAAFLRTMLVAGIPIGAYYVTSNLYNYLDTVMLTAMQGDASVGLYNAAYRFYEGLSMVPLVISTVLMPRLSRHHPAEPEEFRRVFQAGLKYALVIGAWVGLNGVLLAPAVMGLFFGPSYAVASTALRILSVALPVVFSLNFMTTTLISMNRTRFVFVIAAVGLALNGALNLWLIPARAQNGAAVATAVVEAILFVAQLAALRRSAPALLRILTTPVVAVAAAAGAAALAAPAGRAVQVVAADLVFPAAAVLLGFVGPDERAALSRAAAFLRSRSLLPTFRASL